MALASGYHYSLVIIFLRKAGVPLLHTALQDSLDMGSQLTLETCIPPSLDQINSTSPHSQVPPHLLMAPFQARSPLTCTHHHPQT